jgi:uncharacterized protein YodC (DUF2158 family)
MSVQVGDVVQRRGRGPAMTVNKILGERAECIWFGVGGLRLHRKRMRIDSLEPVTPCELSSETLDAVRDAAEKLVDRAQRGPLVIHVPADTPPEVVRTLQDWTGATEEERAAAVAHARKKLEGA